MRSSGTSADRVAAATLLVQQSPAANLAQLDALLGMVSGKGHRDTAAAVDALRELFATALLPDDRTLRPLAANDLEAALAELEAAKAKGVGAAERARERLALWRLEDALRSRYARLVASLGELSTAQLPFLKERALRAAHALLLRKPEQVRPSAARPRAPRPVRTSAARHAHTRARARTHRHAPYHRRRQQSSAARARVRRPRRARSEPVLTARAPPSFPARRCMRRAQERALLKLLVNKLGDPERKVASKAGYLLHGLLEEHPNMAHAVVLEVENFCFRPGISARAQYYAAVFLNQLVLTHRGDGPQVAARLVRLYFALFSRQLERAGSDAKERAEKAAKKAGEKARKARARGKRAPRRAMENAKERAKEAAAPLEAAVDARVLTALLTGVNRAFPYVEEAEAEALIEENSPTLFKLAHSASFGAVTQALALLYKLMEARSAVSDRFYRALYAALAAPALSSSVKAPLFLALLLRACAADVSHARTAAFAKRLLQVAAAARPEFTCGCLLVLSALLQKRPAMWTAVLQSEVMEGDEEERFADEDDEDEDGDKDKKGGYDSDGSDGSGGDAKDPADAANAGADAGAPSGAVVPRGSAGEGGEAERDAGYDASKREPLFARAAGACAWELAALSRHVHPSVAAMARTLLAGAPISYSGDPIVDLSLAPFLDKWLHKAPRLQREGRRRFRGASLMQRVTGAGDGGGEGDEGAGGDKRRAFGGGVSAADGVEALAAAAPEDVLPSDRFFARFIQLKRGGQQQAAARKARVQAELEERQRREDGAEDGHDDFARDGSDDDSDDSDEDGDVAVGSDDSDDDDDDDGVAVGAESDDEDDYDVAEEEDVENDSEGGGDGGSDSEYDDDALRAAIEMDEDAIDAGEQGDGSHLSDVEDDSGADSDAAEGDSDGEEDSDSDGDEPWLFGGEDSSEGDGEGASSEDDASAGGAKGGKRARGSNPFASADDYMEAIEADEYIGKAKGGGKGGGKKGGKPAKRARR